MKRLLLGLALALWGGISYAQVTQTGAVQNVGGQQLGLTPTTTFSQACNAGAGGIVGQGSCVLPVNATVSATVTVAPLTTTTQALTVTTGGTFQSVLASSAGRNGCLVQNPVAATETLFVYFGTNASAATNKSVSLSPGSAVSCSVGGLGVVTDNVSVTATTTAHAFVVYNQ